MVKERAKKKCSERYSVAGFRDRERGIQTKECGQPLDAGSEFSSRAARNAYSPVDTLILA